MVENASISRNPRPIDCPGSIKRAAPKHKVPARMITCVVNLEIVSLLITAVWWGLEKVRV
jgi:hypothetical protein